MIQSEVIEVPSEGAHGVLMLRRIFEIILKKPPKNLQTFSDAHVIVLQSAKGE